MCSASWWAWPAKSISVANELAARPFFFFPMHLLGSSYFLRKNFVFALAAVRRSASKIPSRKVPPSFITRWPTHDEVLLNCNGSNDFAIRIYAAHSSVYVIQRACSITVNLPVIISCCCCHRKSTTRKLGERKHTHTHMLTFWGSFLFRLVAHAIIK